MTLEAKQKPVHKVAFGNIQIAIWENLSTEGKLFHTFDLERSYLDKSEEWKSQRISLTRDEIARVTAALGKVYTDYYTVPGIRKAQEFE